MEEKNQAEETTLETGKGSSKVVAVLKGILGVVLAVLPFVLKILFGMVKIVFKVLWFIVKNFKVKTGSSF